MTGVPSVAGEYAGKFETGAAAPAVPHLRFLDGLRGVAALYVVIHHSFQFSYNLAEFPRAFVLLRWGQAAVAVFIAISGYCLALPVVRSNLTLKGGALHFYKKRARRILVPYYTALAMGVILGTFTTPAGHRLGFLSVPLIRNALLAHLFLYENWAWAYSFMFNGPLWSVAMEAQIYLLFPLIVLAWRRFGIAWVLGVTFVVSHLLFFLLKHLGPANYLFLFVLGAWAAKLGLERRGLTALKATFFLCVAVFLAFPYMKDVYADLFVGVGISCLMAVCARTNFWVRPLLSLGLFTWLGSFSYSIYLIHNVIQHLYLDTALRLRAVPPGRPLFLFMCFVLTPVILGLAYVFHLLIERPFMTVHKVRPQAAQSA